MTSFKYLCRHFLLLKILNICIYGEIYLNKYIFIDYINIMFKFNIQIFNDKYLNRENRGTNVHMAMLSFSTDQLFVIPTLSVSLVPTYFDAVALS